MRAWGSTTVAVRRSSDTVTEPFPRSPKSTTASTVPKARNETRWPLMKEGTKRVSSSMSTSSWSWAEAARYSLRSSSRLSSAGALRSTEEWENGFGNQLHGSNTLTTRMTSTATATPMPTGRSLRIRQVLPPPVEVARVLLTGGAGRLHCPGPYALALGRAPG